MTAVRLLRVPLSAGCSPEAALRALGGDAWPFALTGRWAGGGAIVGSEPLRLAAAGDDPFALLDELPVVEHGVEGADLPADVVGGGWFGWLGYGLGARVERLPPPPPRPAPLPPFHLAYYDHVLRLDAAGRWWFEALAAPEREPALARRLAELGARLDALGAAPLSGAAPTPPPAPRTPFRIAGDGAAAHVAAVADCRERIAAGEIFQANVCLRLEAAWDGDVGELFAHASARLQPAYGAAFPAPWGGVASLSPELFLRRRGRAVETAPIKGTVAREQAADDDRAAAARAALVGSAKDHAEHVMIVDLMRNDLGRVCRYGSIAAAPTPEAQAHPGVWHLVSRVHGQLRPEVGDGELLRATFPPGSVTGAPKVEAMAVIAALESTGREVYTGAIGYASPLAGLELNVAIRTFEARDGRLWLGAGGGIVADSDPERELEECLVKARPLVAAIGATFAPSAGRAAPPLHGAASPPPRRAAPSSPLRPALTRSRLRPDPAAGVFETLLVHDGVALHAARHLARLGASVAALYDAALPDDLAERVARAAEGGDQMRLRVAAVPAGGELDVTVTLAPNPARPLPIALVPFVLPGGLGAHKWLDRRLVDALAREPAGAGPPAAAPGATPLLLDGGGDVLEAAWGNVFAVEGTALVTPPADSRILPGVTRARLLEVAAAAGLAAREEPLPLDRLLGAEAIVLTSAAAVAVPATISAAAAPITTPGPAAFAPAGEHASALAAELRQLLLGAGVPADA